MLTNIFLNLRQIQILDSTEKGWAWKTLTANMLSELRSTPDSFTIMKLGLEQDTINLIERFFPTPNGTPYAGHEDHTVDDPYYIFSSENISASDYEELSSNFEETEDLVDYTSSWILDSNYSLSTTSTDGPQTIFSFTGTARFNANRLSVLDYQFELTNNAQDSAAVRNTTGY